MAGVDDAPGAGIASRSDGVAVLAQRGLAGCAGGHDQNLRGALEGVAKACEVLEVSLAQTDTALAEPAGLLRVADAHADLVSWESV